MAKRAAEEPEDVETSMSDADERAIQEVKEQTARAKEKPPDPDDEPPLEFAEDSPAADHDDDGDAQRPSRQERRQSRIREFEERAERAERAAQAAAALLQQQQRVQQPAQPDDLSRYDDALEANQSDQLRLAEFYQLRLQSLGGKMPPEEERGFLQRSNALKNQEADLRVWRAQRQSGAGQQQPQQDPYAAYLGAKYSDVTTDPEAKAYAAYLYKAGLKRGDPDGPQLLERVLEDTRKHMRGETSQRQRKPTASTQSRYTGSAAGSNGSRGGDDSGGSQGGKVTLPPGLSLKEFQKMADQAYSHIKDDKKRYTHYYREVVAPMQRAEK